ncbi:MAG: RNA-splicing factor [Cirrosporium novae-zelandiae]|nr:MAG: RNA-splicing factor [Cirrosporium novae-zelandiae]
MGGDLNLKKSWHPLLLKNQRRVYDEEVKAIEERKKIQQIQKEREEERVTQELQRQLEAAGGKKSLNRVDWMYNGPANGSTGTTEEMEGYLLGKRRIDGLIKGNELAEPKSTMPSTEDSFITNSRDLALKIREDPMLAIKKQEQAAYENFMSDPSRARKLMEMEASNKKERRDRADDREEGRRRHRHHHHHKPHHSSFQQRSRSPTRHRSRSPYRHSSSSYRDRDSKRRRTYDDAPSRKEDDIPRRREDDTPRRKQYDGPGRRDSPPRRRSPSPPKESMEEKLAAMQKAAGDLDKNRDKRLQAMEARDKVEREAEDAARRRNAKYGGRADFVMGMNRKAGEIGLGERMRRGRGGMEKQEAY